MIGRILKLILGTYNERVLKKIWPIVHQINALEPSIINLSDEELKNKTTEFKERYKKGEVLDSLLPEVFATLREASKRILGMRHFDVQLVGGIVLHKGNISEMKTGEGKTLVATLPIYLHAITGNGVHLVTVNDYLAKRDCEWMGPLYQFIGLSARPLQTDMDNEERKEVYSCDIVYGTTSEFGFDYLRDNMVTVADHKVQRGQYYCIVDEVDSVLIDEARTPLIISGSAEDSSEKYYIADKIVPLLKPAKKGDDGKWVEGSGDFMLEEKDHMVTLTETGIDSVERILKIPDLYEPQYLEVVHAVNQSLRAYHLYKNGKEYLVESDGEVVIVDENTGRKMEGRRYSDGLHQAIEAKEKVQVQRENQTLATITIQNYFKMYKTLAGMTGTAETEATEFLTIYNMDVVVIPTNRKVTREDMSDVIYKNKKAKYKILLDEVRDIYSKQGPILIGTIAVETSEEIARVLAKEKIPHHVLNAKNHEREAEIIAQAGTLGAVTIATNMAGRGTDIVLGGNPTFEADNYLAKVIDRELLKELIPQLFIRAVLDGKIEHAKTIIQDNELFQALGEDKHISKLVEINERWKKDHEEVVQAGGLHVLGTERHEARRIDNQLRGRSGRQGDPGFSRFYMSLEDDLFRIFGSEKMIPWLERAGFKEEDAIESRLITRMIESSQRKVEARNFEIRKHLLQYDEVMNAQRKVIYEIRDKILFNHNVKEEVLFHIEDFIDSEINYLLDGKKRAEGALVHQIISKIKAVTGVELNQDIFNNNALQLVESAVEEIVNAYDKKEALVGAHALREAERLVLLEIIDDKWKNHLYNIDELREGISLRSYGEKNPLVEYQLEASRIFEEMMENMQEEIVTAMFQIKFDQSIDFEAIMASKADKALEYGEPKASKKSTPIKRGESKVGRNETCPCGSGKKYKNCHGKN